MNIDQILNLADRLAIYSGWSSPTVDITILPAEAAFLSKILKTVTGGSTPAIPNANGWVETWPPENPDIGDEIIFLDKGGNTDVASYVEDHDGDQPGWSAKNTNDPTEDNTACWRPFDAPF